MNTSVKPWLVAYDIANPKRLRKVQKRLAQEGFAIQYSVYAFDVTTAGLDRLFGDLQKLADEGHDDIRFFPLSNHTRGFVCGRFLYERDGLIAHGSTVLAILDRLRKNTLRHNALLCG
jgi:CRISPR-associated protein Cas2